MIDVPTLEIVGSDAQEQICPGPSSGTDALIINEAQLIMAEKRTSLSAMRTGISVFALPLSILGLLIATSRYYNLLQVLPMAEALSIILLALIVLGSYLIIQALRHIHRCDRLNGQLKVCHSKFYKLLN